MSEPEVLFQGERFRVERVTRQTPDGTVHAKEIVRHPGAVAMLPLLDDGRICLVENYRYSLDRRMLELPAGTLEPGEDPAKAARRELAEETGYRAGRIEPLGVIYMSPGILDERMTLFLATALEPGPMNLDASEDLEPRLLTWDEALSLMREGRIQDGKTIAALLYYKAFGVSSAK